jgi:hypothetical protein
VMSFGAVRAKTPFQEITSKSPIPLSLTGGTFGRISDGFAAEVAIGRIVLLQQRGFQRGIGVNRELDIVAQ